MYQQAYSLSFREQKEKKRTEQFWSISIFTSILFSFPMKSGYLSYHERSGLGVRESLVINLLQTIQTFLTDQSVSSKV